MRSYLVDIGIDPAISSWALLNGLSITREDKGVCIYRGSREHRLSKEQDTWLKRSGFERLFEACYLPSNAKGNIRAALVRALFDELGVEEYRNGITPKNNLSCYDMLFQGAIERTKDEVKHVLDVGCGPGTILQSEASTRVKSLTGFDFVEANMLEAQKLGLTTMNLERLAGMPEGAFDIFLSAYVLHYESMAEDMLETLIQLLGKDRIWAANFHKSKGLAWFTETLSRIGKFHFECENSPYGPLLFARRVK